MAIRIYDQSHPPNLLRTFATVANVRVDDYGALCIEQLTGEWLYLNPRVWGSVEEADELDQAAVPVAVQETVPGPLPQRQPGALTPLDVPDPLARANGARLREALAVWCTCHRPHQHTPDCPRWPGRYNAHTGPCGWQYTENGEPVDGVTCVLPYLHPPAADGSQGHVFDMVALQRAYGQRPTLTADELADLARGLHALGDPNAVLVGADDCGCAVRADGQTWHSPSCTEWEATRHLPRVVYPAPVTDPALVDEQHHDDGRASRVEFDSGPALT